MDTVLVNPRKPARRRAPVRRAPARRAAPVPARRRRRNPVRRRPGIDVKRTAAELAGSIGAAALEVYALEDKSYLGMDLVKTDTQVAIGAALAMMFTKGRLADVATGAFAYAAGSIAKRMFAEQKKGTKGLYAVPARTAGLGGPSPVRRGATAGLYIVE